MSHTPQHRNTPRLRFPEFKGAWEESDLHLHLVEYKKRVAAPTSLPILSSSREGLKLQKDYYNNREISNDGEYGTVPYGYFTYRHMSDDSQFKFNINYLCKEGAVSKEYPVFTTINMDSTFLLLKLNNSASFQKFAAAQETGGTRTRLYFRKLQQWKTLFPTLPEQQKIAAFLTAVDAKIVAEQQRQALLQRYKKGVMQKLFTQTLRFTQDDGTPFPDWEEKRLGEIAKVFSGGTPTSTNRQYYNGCIPFIKSGEIGQTSTEQSINEMALDQSSAKMIKRGDLLMALYGANSGETAISKIDGAINQAILCIQSKHNIVYIFQYLNFSKEYIKSTFLQGGQGNLSAEIIKSLKITLPHLTEQQKIADHLTALDTQISAATTHITTLQTFKKGLLQQLFV